MPWCHTRCPAGFVRPTSSGRSPRASSFPCHPGERVQTISGPHRAFVRLRREHPYGDGTRGTRLPQRSLSRLRPSRRGAVPRPRHPGALRLWLPTRDRQSQPPTSRWTSAPGSRCTSAALVNVRSSQRGKADRAGAHWPRTRHPRGGHGVDRWRLIARIVRREHDVGFGGEGSQGGDIEVAGPERHHVGHAQPLTPGRSTSSVATPCVRAPEGRVSPTTRYRGRGTRSRSDRRTLMTRSMRLPARRGPCEHDRSMEWARRRTQIAVLTVGTHTEDVGLG
jgi:hypothetical protein